MSWSWRTKPRSIIKTVEWFPDFAALEGQNWNLESGEVSRRNGKPIHPIRRSYIYAAHGEDDAWLAGLSFQEYLHGQMDRNETESNGRNDKTTFEFYGFGYVDEEGRICVTEAGRKIVNGTFDQEDYLKQLLKLRVPRDTCKNSDRKHGRFLFPFQLILRAFARFESLNRSELALLFGCAEEKEIPETLDAVAAFKQGYEELKNKNDTGAVKALFHQVASLYYGKEKLPNDADSYYDYAEAMSRALVYTGLFSASGRSIATKLRIAEHSRMKVKLLQEKYVFHYPEEIDSLEAYFVWYGSSHNVTLPWEHAVERRVIISEKLALYQKKIQETDPQYRTSDDYLRLQTLRERSNDAADVSELKEIEQELSVHLTRFEENDFIHTRSKTTIERQAILDKYEDILSNDDMSALWLEVNTWKSLVAIKGSHQVKRNFKIEEDLSPKSFAPGVGNTPDMELYHDDFILIPEVSLMTGVRQWEHEASSVTDHVLHFITQHRPIPVMGLFLSSAINQRTLWQFFILNRESWMGTPVPVIPLTIRQYMRILTRIYADDLEIEALWTLLKTISAKALESSNYMEWQTGIETTVTQLCGPEKKAARRRTKR